MQKMEVRYRNSQIVYSSAFTLFEHRVKTIEHGFNRWNLMIAVRVGYSVFTCRFRLGYSSLCMQKSLG